MSRYLISTNTSFLLKTLKSRNYFVLRGLHGPAKVNEYSQEAHYPSIPNYKNEDEKRTRKAKEMVQEMSTVEEKMYQINRPKFFGWYSFMISPDYIPGDVLDFSKFATWTTVLDGLPDYFSDEQLDEKASKIISEIGGQIEQVIQNERCHREHSYNVTNDRIFRSEPFATGPGTKSDNYLENQESRNLIKKLHEVIQSHLSLTEEHIKNSAEDYDARNEGFWFRGGIQPDKSMLKKRAGTKESLEKMAERRAHVASKDEDFVNQVYERCFQIHHSSVVQVRHEDPLAEFVSRDDGLCTNLSVPIVDFDPRCWGFKAKCQHGTNIPGYWPEEHNQMGLLSYHTRLNGYNYRSISRSASLTEQTIRDQDVAKGILTNFAWVLPQACHLGFSPLTELTFPLVSQSVNTDGKTWSFFAYQMNTCDLSHNDFSQHTHQNILWAQEPVQLYSKVEDGKVVNFDPDCLKPLIKMYLNTPRRRNYNMTPYLGSTKKLVDFPDDYQRTRFFTIMRNQLSNRPKPMKKPELYLWEKLLLVDNKTMPQLGQDRRRRWWHIHKIDFLGKEHWHPEFINTDEKRHKYVAKGMREEWTRKGTLNRRYNKFVPKIQVPLKDKIAVYQLPDTKYKGEPDD